MTHWESSAYSKPVSGSSYKNIGMVAASLLAFVALLLAVFSVTTKDAAAESDVQAVSIFAQISKATAKKQRTLRTETFFGEKLAYTNTVVINTKKKFAVEREEEADGHGFLKVVTPKKFSIKFDGHACWTVTSSKSATRKEYLKYMKYPFTDLLEAIKLFNLSVTQKDASTIRLAGVWTAPGNMGSVNLESDLGYDPGTFLMTGLSSKSDGSPKADGSSDPPESDSMTISYKASSRMPSTKRDCKH